VAGIGVEFQMQDLGGRSTKRAMRTLQIITESKGISQEAIEEYKTLVEKSSKPAAPITTTLTAFYDE
jgi:hypothetical protein